MNGIRAHIVLVGFMGCGKSTIGRLLAQELDLEFVDVDTVIETNAEKSIKEIFAQHGEDHFRQLESIALNEVLNQKNIAIIATGGGAPCFNDNMNKIKKKSTSVYLKVGRDKLVKRLKKDTERPLLQNKNEKELLKFVATTLSQRETFYLDSDITVRAIKSPSDICQRIMDLIMKID